MHFVAKPGITTLLLAASMHTASASTLDALTLLRNYNLITSGNVTSSSEVDGNALIGGNVSGGMYNMHMISTAVPSLTVAGNLSGNIITKGKDLHVGGDVSGSVTMNDGGNAYVGSVVSGGSLTNNANGSGNTYVLGTLAGSVNTNGGSTINGGTRPFDPAATASDAMATLSAFSAQLSGLTANSSYSFSGSKVTFNAVAGANGLAVFDIADASGFFSQAAEFEFNLNGASGILFNVSDSAGDAANDLNIHANFLAGSAPLLGSKMLWNFTNAQKITLASQFGGSMLAVFADTSNSNNIEGTLVAKSLTQYGEIHSQPLDPNYPSAVPLPPAAPLFGAALAAIGAVARRRNGSKAS